MIGDLGSHRLSFQSEAVVMSASVHGAHRAPLTALTSKPNRVLVCLFVHLFVFNEKIKILTQLGCSILYKRLTGHFKG